MKKYGEQYVNWISEGKGKDSIQEHRDHEKYIQEKLSKENVDKLTESQFTEIYAELWVSKKWGNKSQWSVTNQIISPNGGFQRIKEELGNLLYGPDDFGQRYNHFIENIKGIRISSISEILNFIFPNKFCLWNNTSKSVLTFFGLDKILPKNIMRLDNWTISGVEYYQCVQFVENIRNEFIEFGIKDFIDIDIFFWHIYKDLISTTKKESTEEVLNEGIQSIQKQGDVSRRGRFFDDELIEYLRRTYEMRVEIIKRSWLKLNDTVVYVNGSKRLPKGEGFYDIDERYYKILIERPNHYYAIVFDEPEKTFVIPGQKLKEIFEGRPFYQEAGKTGEWLFTVYVKEERHMLKLRNAKDEYDLENFLNKWSQIADLRIRDKAADQKIKELAGEHSLARFWKVAPGENASLWEESKVHKVIAIGWNELGDLSNRGLDEVREDLERQYPDSHISIMNQFKDFLSIKEGDIIIANKGYSKILGMGTVKGSYQYRPDLTFHHTYPVEWFDTKERDIPPQTGVWRKTISPVDADLYNKIISGTWKNFLLLRHQPGLKRDKSERTYWNDLLGKEYHFGKSVPNFKKISPSTKTVWFYADNMDLYLWGYGEVDTVKGLTDDKFIATYNSFRLFDNNGSAIRATNSVQEKIKSLNSWSPYNSIIEVNQEIYEDIIRTANENEIGWSFDIEKAIDDILLVNTERELAIDRQLVKRILIHLKAGKHVILVGPPGVGKTDLAKRILEIIGKKVIGNDSFLESVASDEWSRYELIGGVNLANEFQEGWVTKAAVDHKWLLIDEFNRANMNKAFGELFLAIEYGKITLRPTESKRYKKDTIEIPQNFRMICTMNDFDKNLLLTELSYGLISRFAFVPITPDIQREPIVVERRVKSLLGNDDSYENCIEQIKLYFEFINHVRGQRNIGVRTSMDIVKYIISATKDGNNYDDNYKRASLNNALCDYVLPQFDRLDGKTIDAVLTYANSDLVGEVFKPLREELQKASSRLQKAAGWLTNKDAI